MKVHNRPSRIGLIAAMFFLCAVKSNDYYCSITLDHLLCDPYEVNLRCEGYRAIHVNDEMKKIIIDGHNNLRNKIATRTFVGAYESNPIIPNMLEISWSDLLALAAQKLANRCAITPSTYDQRKFPFFKDLPKLGQFLFSVEKSTKQPIMIWKDLMEEINDINFNKPTKISDLLDTELVIWPSTYLIGCAQAGFRRNSTNNIIALCIYGTMTASNPIREGPPCSKCPDGGPCSSTYKGLCSSKELSRPSFTDYMEGAGEYPTAILAPN